MIVAKNLTKIFGNVKALDNVSFEIADGSIYGLVGSNGSGKSTLLRLISGVYKADGGSIGIDGISSFDNPMIKMQIAYLGDTPYFLPQSDLKDMKRLYSSMYPSFDKEVYNHLLSVFPLNENARLSSFSKGMQRQAAIILALSTKPRYLLLDEAFDGLDVVMRRVLANLVSQGVEEQGMTVVIASHNLRELEDICDHVCLIHNGNIRMNGSIDGLCGRVRKVQAAFKTVPELTVFEALDVLKIERTGSLLQMVVRGEECDILSFMEQLSPVFVECVEPTLEEIFVYELEVTGYDVKNILS